MRVLNVTDTTEVPEPTGTCVIEHFNLWNADRDLVYDAIYDGTNAICKEDFNFSIEAVATSPTCKTVDFELTGPDGFYYSRTERNEIWTLFGNKGNNVKGRLDSIPVGDYTLKAVGSDGRATTEKVINFAVQNCELKCEITRFELWDATDNTLVEMNFENGDTIYNNKFGRKGYNIKAVTTSGCNKVVFEVSGDSNGYFHEQTENVSPYFAWANRGSNILGVTLDADDYTLKAFGDGEARLEKMLSFTVDDTAQHPTTPVIPAIKPTTGLSSKPTRPTTSTGRYGSGFVIHIANHNANRNANHNRNRNPNRNANRNSNRHN